MYEDSLARVSNGPILRHAPHSYANDFSPITQIPLMLLQENIGAYIRNILNFGWLDFMSIQGTIPFFDKEVNLANFAVGVVFTATGLAILAFPTVCLFYALVPKKYLQYRADKSKAKKSKVEIANNDV